MKLQAPKLITFWIAVALGVLGIIGYFAFPAYAFWLVLVGLILLALGNLLKGLTSPTRAGWPCHGWPRLQTACPSMQ